MYRSNKEMLSIKSRTVKSLFKFFINFNLLVTDASTKRGRLGVIYFHAWKIWTIEQMHEFKQVSEKGNFIFVRKRKKKYLK